MAIAIALVTAFGPSPSGATPWAGAQATADPVTEAAGSLGRDPVYVDPEAERTLTDDEADDLRAAIRASGTPVFVAVLPASAGGAPDVVEQIRAEVGLAGTYAAVVGDSFRAASSQLPDANEIATAAFQAESADGAAAVLSRFVDDVSSAAAGGSGGASGSPNGGARPGAEGTGDRTSEDDGGGSGLVPLGLLVAGGAGVAVWSSRRRNRRLEAERAERAAQLQMLRAELSIVADDVLRLEDDVVLHPDARDDYEAAVERHRIAAAALESAEPVDPVRVERVVAEARYAMARARAIIDGRQPPAPPDELRQPGRHHEPPLDLDEQGAPVYAGGQPFYGGGGWFGGGMGSGLFGGLLLGSMLGGPFGWGGWGGGPIIIDNDGGDGGGGDGGGWGDGGGFGDRGGGDWGGDMGGGDW